jgi:hypothetical protein
MVTLFVARHRVTYLPLDTIVLKLFEEIKREDTVTTDTEFRLGTIIIPGRLRFRRICPFLNS